MAKKSVYKVIYFSFLSLVSLVSCSHLLQPLTVSEMQQFEKEFKSDIIAFSQKLRNDHLNYEIPIFHKYSTWLYFIPEEIVISKIQLVDLTHFSFNLDKLVSITRIPGRRGFKLKGKESLEFNLEFKYSYSCFLERKEKAFFTVYSPEFEFHKIINHDNDYLDDLEIIAKLEVKSISLRKDEHEHVKEIINKTIRQDVLKNLNIGLITIFSKKLRRFYIKKDIEASERPLNPDLEFIKAESESDHPGIIYYANGHMSFKNLFDPSYDAQRDYSGSIVNWDLFSRKSSEFQVFIPSRYQSEGFQKLDLGSEDFNKYNITYNEVSKTDFDVMYLSQFYPDILSNHTPDQKITLDFQLRLYGEYILRDKNNNFTGKYAIRVIFKSRKTSVMLFSLVVVFRFKAILEMTETKNHVNWIFDFNSSQYHEAYPEESTYHKLDRYNIDRILPNLLISYVKSLKSLEGIKLFTTPVDPGLDPTLIFALKEFDKQGIVLIATSPISILTQSGLKSESEAIKQEIQESEIKLKSRFLRKDI